MDSSACIDYQHDIMLMNAIKDKQFYEEVYDYGIIMDAPIFPPHLEYNRKVFNPLAESKFNQACNMHVIIRTGWIYDLFLNRHGM